MTYLNEQRKQALLGQLENINGVLRHCEGNGCDVHEVAQMLQMVMCLRSMISKSTCEAETAETRVKNLWDRHLDYVKKKFSYRQ